MQGGHSGGPRGLGLLDCRQELELIAKRLTSLLEGYSSWSLWKLSQRVVALGPQSPSATRRSTGHQENGIIRRTVEHWVIQPSAGEEFATATEEVLETYERPSAVLPGRPP